MSRGARGTATPREVRGWIASAPKISKRAASDGMRRAWRFVSFPRPVNYGMLAFTTMPRVELAIDGDVCGPLSVGTVAVIRAIEKHLGLPLAEATEFVNRCVFESERVSLPAPTRTAAENLLIEFERLPAASRLHASLGD